MRETIGKYQILGLLGSGGMGSVHRAYDPLLDREVALKTISGGAFDDDTLRKRFLREARSVARLQHPNIVTVYDFGEHQGRPYLVMELLDGQDLGRTMNAHQVGDLTRRLEIIDRVCRALAYAHSCGVVHRDIKPANVHVLADGQIKVVDFGLAWFEGAMQATGTHELVGTPRFMAPEHFAEETIGPAADQWAVGVLLYALLSNRLPFDSERLPPLINKILNEDPPPLGIDPAMEGVVLRALAKDPTRRFPDLEAMRQALLASIGSSERPLEVSPAESMAFAQRPTPVRTKTSDAWSQTASGARRSISGSMRARDLGELGERCPTACLQVDPSGELLALGGVDGAVRLWRLAERLKVATLRNRNHRRTGHAALITAMDFSADGTLLATSHLDGRVVVWDCQAMEELAVDLSHSQAAIGVCFSADAKMLASGGADSTLKLWEVEALRAGEGRRTLRRQPAPLSALGRVYSLVVSGHDNRQLRCQQIDDGRLVATLHGHESPVSVILGLPDTTRFLAGDRGGVIRIWDYDERRQVTAIVHHSRPVAALALFPDQRRVASVARGGELLIWDLVEQRKVLELVDRPDEDPCGIAIVDDGQTILAALADGRIRCFELTSLD